MPKYIVEAESIEDLLDGYHSVPSELVLCKDCKHFIEHGFPWGMCEVRGCTALPDFYCAWAERRTDDNGLD